jgi:hypothetical protein
VKFNPKGLIVTAVFGVVLWVVLQTHTISTFEMAVRIVLWPVIVVLSVAAVVASIRHRTTPITQLGAWQELKRWFHVVNGH